MTLLVTEIDPQLSSSTSTLDLLHLDLKKFRNLAMIFLVRETTGIVVWFITIKTRIKITVGTLNAPGVHKEG